MPLNVEPDVRPLCLTDEETVTAGALLTEFLRSYEASLGSRKVMPALDREQLQGLFESAFPETGVGVERLFREISEKVVPNSTTIAHARFLAYVLGPPNGIAPYAEAIAATLNQNCNFWQLSPAASVIEKKVVAWLSSLFGFPETAGGLLTSGGSMANLIALSAAVHEMAGIDVRQSGLSRLTAPLVVYTSAEAHRCIEKAAAILGLGLDYVRKIPVDDQFRMRTDLLKKAIGEDRRTGLRPLCVVATAGTVNTGAIDPIDEIADVCAREKLWFHVDGAYGALFILCHDMEARLSACRRADSIALDPHKLLMAPLEAGCLIVRDRLRLRNTFQFQSSYLTVDEDPLLVNYLDYGPQLSRDFKAFKVWCALQMFGIGAFRAAAARMLELSQYMAQRIAAEPSLGLMAPVTLTAICFRFINGASDAQVLAMLVEEGTALLGPVRIDGRDGIRACITNFRTSKSDIDLTLSRLVELGARLHLRESR